MIPSLARGETLINAAIRAEQQSLADRRFGRFVFVLWLGRLGRRSRSRLNGKCVAIGVAFFGEIFPKIFAAIIGNEQREPEYVNALIVGRIDSDLAEIKWSRIDRADTRPFFAAILGTEDTAAFAPHVHDAAGAAFVTLDYCHHNFWIARTYRQTDTTGLAGQSAGQFFPIAAAIRALKNSAHILAAGCSRTGSKTPWRSLSRIKRCVNDVWIGRIDCGVATAGPRIMWRGRLQDRFPGFAAVGCFEKATLAAVGPEMPARGHVSHFRFSWIDNHAANRAAFLQSDVF